MPSNSSVSGKRAAPDHQTPSGERPEVGATSGGDGSDAGDSGTGDASERNAAPENALGLGGWGDAFQDIAPYLDLGWRVATVTALPPGIGFAIDLWIGSLPWGVGVGAALGLSGAAVQLSRLELEMEQRAQQTSSDASASRPSGSGPSEPSAPEASSSDRLGGPPGDA
jgi:hypothetical protein